MYCYIQYDRYDTTPYLVNDLASQSIKLTITKYEFLGQYENDQFVTNDF